MNGALKALNAGLNPLMAAVLGMITAIGGGIARDILTIRIPMVLQSEIYAVAALTSAAIAAFGLYFGLPFWPVVIVAGVLGTSLRLAAITGLAFAEGPAAGYARRIGVAG